jgi:chitodextrinase
VRGGCRRLPAPPHLATASARTVDNAAPTAPSALAAAEVDPFHIALAWTGSTDNVKVTGYKLYRNGKYLKTVTATSYTDGGLAANTTYSYYVTARDAVGNESAASNTAGAATLDTTPPTAPTLTVKPSNTLYGPAAALTWTASSDNVKVAGYNVYRNGVLLKVNAPGTRSYTDTTPLVGTDSYYVVAFDAAGNLTASKTVSLTF